MVFCVHIPFSVLGFGLVWVYAGLLLLSQSLWVHIGISPIVSGRCFFLGIIHRLWLLRSFWFLFCIAPWTLRGGFDKYIPFGAECFTCLFCGHYPVAGLCASFHVLQEAPSLMRAEPGTDLWVVIRSHFVAMFCSRIIVVDTDLFFFYLWIKWEHLFPKLNTVWKHPSSPCFIPKARGRQKGPQTQETWFYWKLCHLTNIWRFFFPQIEAVNSKKQKPQNTTTSITKNPCEKDGYVLHLQRRECVKVKLVKPGWR